MARLAFCGLGLMGIPMAGRLLAAGHQVTVWNRTPGKEGPLVEAGAKVANSAAAAAADAEATITMLADPAAVEEVLFGAGGVVSAMPAGSTLIEMSTVGPEVSAEIRGRLPAGIEMMDAPVAGTVPQVLDGSLRILVGASDASFERWRDVLADIGQPIHAGPPGSGSAVKLVVNASLLSVLAVVGESLALADALGLDQSKVLDILAESPNGLMVKRSRKSIETDSYPVTFKIALADKDLRLVTEAASRGGKNLRIASALGDYFSSANAAGLGENNYSEILRYIRQSPPA
ncbi:MAG: NAD-binding protein [Dehalococcoidia bacterium]|nr:NAD-binding protein [Dehalococcoidia bacterium]